MAPGGGTTGLWEALLYELSEVTAAQDRLARRLAVLDPRGMLEALIAEDAAAARGHAGTARELAQLCYDAARLERGGQLLHEATVGPRQRLKVLRRPPAHLRDEG